MGLDEANTSVAAAQALGIAPGSTLWYDLEGYNNDNDACRESALSFLSAWTTQLHELGYVSGVYSSAGSGILALDDARVNRPDAFVLPDQIWLARWDGKANTTTHYLRGDGWRPHARIKQYQGGHDETWGGVTINIDRDYLDVGLGSVAAPETHCDGTKIAFWAYDVLRPPTADYTPPAPKVKALQCLLQEQELYRGQITGTLNDQTITAWRAWQTRVGMVEQNVWTVGNWMALLSYGYHPIIKFGSADPSVRRLQRTLNAARPTAHLNASGVFDEATARALQGYQSASALEPSAVAGPETWRALGHGIH